MPAHNTMPSQLSLSKLARHIDHTLLKPEASEQDILVACEQADHYQFVSLCINPCYVALTANALRHSQVKVASVVGFPLGTQTPYIKTAEAQEALENGAREIDMVIHIGALKSRKYNMAEQDIQSIARLCHQTGSVLKVILETCLLTDKEKHLACTLCVNAEADMVKTSTGFGASGATIEDVSLLHKLVSPHNLGVKASGGIRTLDDTLAMLQAGATRIGTSRGVNIIRELQQKNREDDCGL